MRLCFFGDSFVNGTGDPAYLGWVGRLCAAMATGGHDLTGYNLGIRRDTSVDIARRWHPEAALRLPPDSDGRLVFSFGVNDCVVEAGARRVPLEQTIANAQSIIAQATRWKPTLVVGPPPLPDSAVNERIGVLSNALGDLCRDLGVPYRETFDWLGRSSVWMAEVASGDGAHPGADGYRVLADHVSDWSAWQDWFGAFRMRGAPPPCGCGT